MICLPNTPTPAAVAPRRCVDTLEGGDAVERDCKAAMDREQDASTSRARAERGCVEARRRRSTVAKIKDGITSMDDDIDEMQQVAKTITPSSSECSRP